MDPILLHLRANHFPLVLGMLGAAAMVVALVSRHHVWLRYAQITLILAAIAAPIAYFSGDEALDTLRERHTWYIDRQQAHDHEEADEQAAIALVITGIIAAVSVWKNNRAMKVVLLIAGLVSAVLVSIAGYEGGKIEHENQVLIKSTAPPGVLTAPAPTR